MRFNEFIEFIEKRYKGKVLKLENERCDLNKRYDDLLDSYQKMKPPIFKKKHPLGYFVAGITFGVVLLSLTLVLMKLFPLVPSGLFVIPSSLIASFVAYAGYEITKMSNNEKGEDSIRYIEYQNNKKNSGKEMDMILERRKKLGNELGVARKRVESIDITSCKECYTYLIPSSLKGKTIEIDERLLDELLTYVPLDVIIYKYYHEELENFVKLSEYEQIHQIIKLDLKHKIEKIKSEIYKELEKQKELPLLEQGSLNRQPIWEKSSNTRQRRTERNKNYYSDLQNAQTENEEINHRR